MNSSTILALAGLGVAAFAAVWPVRQWIAQKKAGVRKRRIDDENALRDDQREWYERMSETNRNLLARVDRLEKARETDRQLIFGLRDYIRRIIAANPDIKIPPMPPELGL